MKTGDIVYLCETYFYKFREMYDWMSSTENKFNEPLVDGKYLIPKKIINNEFYVVANLSSKTLISLRDSEFDYNLASRCPAAEVIDFYSTINQEKKLYCHNKDICQMLNTIHGIAAIRAVQEFDSSKIAPRNYMFLFDVEKLTVIE